MVLAAEYTNGSKTRSAVLDITRIETGARQYLATHNVAGRADARKLAKALGATPWNF